jgi:hypothetical protein
VGPGGVDASYMTKVFPGTVPLSNLPELAKKSLAVSDAQAAKVLSTRLVDVAGGMSGRIEAENRVDALESRQLVYLLSGRDHFAVVKVVAQKSEYDDAAAKLEAMLPQIHGLAPPERIPTGGVSAAAEAQGKLGLWLALIGLAGYLGKKLRRLKRRA